jgi:ParB-like chromosome segregation protein Spo0J
MKLKELKLNKANPRFIKDDKFKKLLASIKDFPKMMELRPIVYDTDGTILGGNMRYRALTELGYKDIPDTWAKRADELTADEKRRFIIEDNVGFGDWDMESLADQWDLEELEAWGVDLPDDWGSDVIDIEEVDEFNESVNFTIKCESIEQLEELQTKLSISAQKIGYDEFLIKVGL